jgi:hypothetical protein
MSRTLYRGGWSVVLLSTIASSFTVSPTNSNGRAERSGVRVRQQIIDVEDQVDQSLIDPKAQTHPKKLLIHWVYVQSIFENRPKYTSYLIISTFSISEATP